MNFLTRFKRNNRALIFIVIFCLLLFQWQPVNAVERKKPTWLSSCPDVIDTTPEIAAKETQNLRFLNTGQVFTLLATNSVEPVMQPQSIIGCYVDEDQVSNPNSSPDWQIGSLSRDLNGYYFKNGAGVIWRLSLGTDGFTFETLPGSTYYKQGLGFRIDSSLEKSIDCKVKDSRLGPIRLGFPRNNDRVPQLGTTQNLILVVDFPDAKLTESLDSVVNNVLSPRTVEKFLNASSNGKFSPTFTTFPTVVTLNSLDTSFAPNSPGRYFNQGIQQDHRVVKEAISLANLQGHLDRYSSINVFAPTSKSLGYYGSAFFDMPLDVGGKSLANSQLVGQVGAVNSQVPSWKVFAHEYGHLLGMYDYYIPGTGSSGKSPGPFDFMGNTTGSANSYFGFQRWVQGWIEDTDVICDFTTNSSATHTLAPLNQNSGKRLYVHPLDGTTTLVIEFRTESEFDILNGNDGLLVYLIDMKVGSLKGPISIQPSEQDLILNPRDDVERFSTAPLSSAQTVKVKDLVIIAEEVTKERATFRVLTSVEYRAKQEVEFKVALELKAKQEAATKTAAELTAKKDAEALAAAELNAKREAKAKVVELAAANKKTTITCTKGKLSRKVTSIKPVCPYGYKKK